MPSSIPPSSAIPISPSGPPPSRGPLALLLSGGGARAAYQVGVLAAIAEKAPELRFPILAGVSAGAINIAYLAAHPGTLPEAAAGLRQEWGRLTTDQVYAFRPPGILRGLVRLAGYLLRGGARTQAALRGLMDLRPLRAFLSRCIDFDQIDGNLAAGRLRAVALSSTSYAAGATVTFVHGVPGVPTWERAQRVAVRTRLRLEHVMASSAIPIVFPAVNLEDGFYGDGSVRMGAPLAPPIHLGARRIVAIGMRARRPTREPVRPSGEYPTAVDVIGLLFHSIFLDALDEDAERLERVNELLRALPASAPVPQGLRPVDLLVIRPSRDLGALAEGYTRRLPRFGRWVVGVMGAQGISGADFISYLLFDPAYTGVLIELGHADGLAQWDRIERFLAGEHSGPPAHR